MLKEYSDDFLNFKGIKEVQLICLWRKGVQRESTRVVSSFRKEEVWKGLKKEKVRTLLGSMGLLLKRWKELGQMA